jgi:hypothetical protein
MSVESDPVYWPEFKFWLKQVTNYYKDSYDLDEITDWGVEQNGMPLDEFLLSAAAGQATKARAVEAKAAELGIALTEGDLAEIAGERADNVAIYGSESEYLWIIQETYGSEDVFDYLTKVDYLSIHLFGELYGVNGEKCSDDDVSAYVTDVGFMCAGYIFLSSTDDDGDELSAEQKAENRDLLEGIVGRLHLSADPITLFGSLIDQYSEGPSVASYPDGYLLAPGTMGEGFESVCADLSEGEYSGVVEAAGGLYVILRMPIYPDMAVDSSGTTLRCKTAYEYAFQNDVDGWSADLDVTYKDVYSQIDVEGLFGPGR